MTLDNDILDKARNARDTFMDLQHSTEVARVDYHHTIRQLHVAGGSLREIADALGLSHQRVHQIVEPVDGADPGSGRGGPHPHMHRMKRRLVGLGPFNRMTEPARNVVLGAIEASAELGHRRVGSEHFLVGLAGSPADSAVGKAFAALGLTRASVTDAVTKRLGTGPAGSPGRRPFTSAARRILGGAFAVAEGADVAPEHLLLAIVADHGDGASILAELGATPERVREALA